MPATFSYPLYATDTEALNPQSLLGDKKYSRTCAVRGRLGRFYIVRKAKFNTRVEDIRSGEQFVLPTDDLCLIAEGDLWCNEDADLGEVPACSEVIDNEVSAISPSPVPNLGTVEAPFHLYPRVGAEIQAAIAGAAQADFPRLVTPILRKYFRHLEPVRRCGDGRGYCWDFYYYGQSNTAFVTKSFSNAGEWSVSIEGDPGC